jgi:hypothetical protein
MDSMQIRNSSLSVPMKGASRHEGLLTLYGPKEYAWQDYENLHAVPGNPSGIPVYVRMEEPGRFHDATLVLIRQPDRRAGAVFDCADAATRRTIPRNLFATPEKKCAWSAKMQG